MIGLLILEKKSKMKESIILCLVNITFWERRREEPAEHKFKKKKSERKVNHNL